jgi:hypothetical protein
MALIDGTIDGANNGRDNSAIEDSILPVGKNKLTQHQLGQFGCGRKNYSD